MTERTRISHFSLSVLALGLYAFSASASAANDPKPTEAATPIPVQAQPANTQDVEAQANNLRNLFEAAGRKGLVDLKPSDENAASSATAPTAPRVEVIEVNCMMLAPLFDGGQGGFATGLFTELRSDWPENKILAGTLADLIDPGYDGRTLPIDLSTASECGPSFLPWQTLANPAEPLSPADEGELTATLAKMVPALRRQIGVQIAIRAGLAGNMRLTRRVSDTLIDAGLHGQSHHDRDPEHLLLDSILKLSRDPIGARARLSWIAERDGPEQLTAIDLMRQIDAAPAAQSELERLADSPDEMVRLSAEQRLLANAIEDFDIALVSQLVTNENNLANDTQSRARLAARLEEAVVADDPIKAVQALDVMQRLELKGVDFTPELKAKAQARMVALTTGTQTAQSTDFTSSLPTTPAPADLNGPELIDYLGALGTDMDAYREVLSRG